MGGQLGPAGWRKLQSAHSPLPSNPGRFGLTLSCLASWRYASGYRQPEWTVAGPGHRRALPQATDCSASWDSCCLSLPCDWRFLRHPRLPGPRLSGLVLPLAPPSITLFIYGTYLLPSKKDLRGGAIARTRPLREIVRASVLALPPCLTGLGLGVPHGFLSEKHKGAVGIARELL